MSLTAAVVLIKLGKQMSEYYIYPSTYLNDCFMYNML